MDQALNQAVVERLIPDNPARNIMLPRIEYNEIEPLTNEEIMLKEYKSPLPLDTIMVVPQLNSDKPINFSRIFSQWCEKAD